MPLSLPERASYEFLKKLAKERLVALRVADPSAKLAAAQLAIAREYGFSSWRALKVEIDRRRAPHIAAFMRACTAGDVHTLAELLKKDSSLARERVAAGSTGLHLAVRHPDVLRLLLQHGADPNIRDDGDNPARCISRRRMGTWRSSDYFWTLVPTSTAPATCITAT